MKGTKRKVVAQQREANEYERKRMENIKQNAEFMTAKGCGTVAAKILQANANTFSKDVRDDALSHSDDEDYIPIDYEVDNNEEITSSKVYKIMLHQF